MASTFFRPMPDETGETSTFPILTSVRVTFDPYSYQKVQTLLRNVQDEFGPNSGSLDLGTGDGRWEWTAGDNGEQNSFAMDFWFANPQDAIMFSLKYSR